MEFLNILLIIIAGIVTTLIGPRIWQINNLRRKIWLDISSELVEYYGKPLSTIIVKVEEISNYYLSYKIYSEIKTRKIIRKQRGYWNNTELPRDKFPNVGINLMKQTFIPKKPNSLFVLIGLHIQRQFEKELRVTIDREFGIIIYYLTNLENCNKIEEVVSSLSLINYDINNLIDNVGLFSKKLIEQKIKNPSFFHIFKIYG